MADSVITDNGKTEALRLIFVNDNAHGAFSYMALGGANSQGAKGQNFVEVMDNSYHRVETKKETNENKSISVSAIFDETNFNVSEGELITEIGLVNSAEYASDQIFFCYCEVPNIKKDDTISLKYTIVIEIE